MRYVSDWVADWVSGPMPSAEEAGSPHRFRLRGGERHSRVGYRRSCRHGHVIESSASQC